MTESAATLTALGYTVANTKAATLDQLFIATASTLASAVSSCQNAVKALDPTLFTGISDKTIVTSSTCSYGTAASVTSVNRCTTLSDAF